MANAQSVADIGIVDRIAQAIRDLVEEVPESTLSRAADPKAAAEKLTAAAASKAALISGSLTLPPGPLGMLTIIPDLAMIWRLQSQLVADIAAVYGKSAKMIPEGMLYCLFRHAAAKAVERWAVGSAARVVNRAAAQRAMQESLKRIGVAVSGRVAAKSVARWVPFVGAAAVAAYAYFDTRQVGKTATEFIAGL